MRYDQHNRHDPQGCSPSATASRARRPGPVDTPTGLRAGRRRIPMLRKLFQFVGLPRSIVLGPGGGPANVGR